MHTLTHPTVLRLLQAAGWSPERRVPVPAALSDRLIAQGLPEHPALGVLATLGGLHVGEVGAGEECARSDLAFGWLQDCETDDEVEQVQVQRWQALLGTRLIGIASVHHGHADLLMASDGRCFGMSLMHDAFWLDGLTLDEALQRLLLGQRSRPMVCPGCSSVGMWGEDFTREHPLVYAHDTKQQ